MMASSMVTTLRVLIGTQLGSVGLLVPNWSVVPASHTHLCRQGLNILIALGQTCYLQVV